MARTHYRDEPAVGEPMDDSRIRGLDIPATIGGFLAGLATLTILGSIAGAALGGAVAGGELTGNLQTLAITGAITAAVVLFVSFIVGGWVAGRMSRFDGGRNGAFTVVWALLLGAILAGLGALIGDQFNVTARANLPQFFEAETMTASGIIGALIALAVMLLGGFLGGRLGDRYHRRVDQTAVAYGPVTGAAPLDTHERTEDHGFERDDDVVRRQDAEETERARSVVRGHEATHHTDER